MELATLVDVREITIASQLGSDFTASFFSGLNSFKIFDLPIGSPKTLPDDAEILVAMPFRKAGGVLPKSPPNGWPFSLKWVHLISVGIDFYPEWLFDGVTVTTTRGSSAVPLSEFALAAIFAAAKRFPNIWIDGPDNWQGKGLSTINGATLGIVGFGGMGEALASRAMALGMNVLAIRRSEAPMSVPGVERARSISEIFERSDHVVLAAPATPDTHRIVNRDILAHSKPGLHLVNLSRGTLIDDDALLDALDTGKISLASLDVTDPEPLPEGHPFYTHPRIRLSPHTAVYTPDTWRNLAAHFAGNLARFRAGLPLDGMVDLARGY